MKAILYYCLCFCIVLTVSAQDQQVFITGFEEVQGLQFNGGQVSFSLEEDGTNQDGVVPYEGDGLMVVEYDNTGNVWGWSQFNFAETVDATGMRNINLLVYFLPDTIPNDDNVYELRLRLSTDITGDGNPNEVALGYKSNPTNPETGEPVAAEDVPGQWVNYSWEIDTITSENHLSELAGFGLSIMPGDDGKFGIFYLDNIYASRPADFPAQLEEVLIYDFDTEDLPITPAGWEPNAGQMVIGDGFIEPSQGTNYMEIWIGAGWIQEARTIDAKGASDLWARATDIIMDVQIADDFAGTWLLLNPTLQSGGDDADGNPLARVSGWDGYGERELRNTGFLGDWKTIAWPFRLENHIDALTNDGGWFTVNLITNKDSAEAGKSLYIDNFRLAVAPDTTGVNEWSLY